MIPTIIVFVDTPASEHQSLVIDQLLKLGYAPLVDAKHGSEYGWFLENTHCPHRLYRFDWECFTYTVEDLDHDMEKVDLMIAFNEELELSNEQWKDILNWFCSLNPKCEEIEIYDLQFLEKPTVAPNVQIIKNTDLLGEEPEIVNYPDCYGFRQIFKDNIAFYEITKPHTDRPYTTYVEDYQNKVKDLFSNFFISTSWGVAPADINFLKELWKWKMMDTSEEFDCEKLLKERIDRCRNGEPEPRVYRKTLEDVMEMYFTIKEKVGEKRKVAGGNSSIKRLA
jgi:hypothetical protein